MNSFSRIAIMTIVSLLAVTFYLGGYTLNGFEIVGPMVVIFGGIPIIALVILFHVLDRAWGAYARYPIALIGLIPLVLAMRYKWEGDLTYIEVTVLSGFVWSFVWLATSRRSSHLAA